MNINFYNRLKSFIFLCATAAPFAYLLAILSVSFLIFGARAFIISSSSASENLFSEPIQACVVARERDLTDDLRAQFAQCLGWQSDQNSPICLGAYQPLTVTPLANAEEIKVIANNASLYKEKPSALSGNVTVQQAQRIVNAQTAYIYRDTKTNQVTKVEFLGNVHYLEPDRLMIARKAVVNPQDNSGLVTDVLYRFNADRAAALLPAWGRARFIKRYPNKDYFLRQATYTTCAPKDKTWDLEAKSIKINNAQATGVAKNAVVRIRRVPVFYTPYLSFPTNKDRKSGFLLPMFGYSNIAGFDFGLPYYWNIAPNYDMTLTPHLYSERGVMLGGEFRYLTAKSYGVVRGNFLPDDKAYKNFIQNNELFYPRLQGSSYNRWSAGISEQTWITPNLVFHALADQVSDDYYLQDFSSNWAQITQKQLLRQADLTYSIEHWTFSGMVQNYQTLNPVNEPPTASVYELLPQLAAQGTYYNLPFNANLNLLGQYAQFHWPKSALYPDLREEGPRVHLNPILSVPLIKPWGFFTPSVEFVENYYQIDHLSNARDNQYNLALARYSLNTGLFFERSPSRARYTQTLEPRLFYLNVPYQNQSQFPIYDAANLIFNTDQLVRTNRFSGYDRIGDANQLAYAVTTRWLRNDTGAEKASFTIGQIKYFSERRVQLCQSLTGACEANPNTIGYLSPTYDWSPVASRAVYTVNSSWALTGDYIWDPATKATNNADLNLHFTPYGNAIVSGGYSYVINADTTSVRNNEGQNNALHQVIAAYSLPLSAKWSTLGAYSQNISKNYSMMSLFGVQYDSCCWAMRVLGGRTFKNLNARFEPQYNNNIYLQFLLKGLGSVATSDPYALLGTYIPGYTDPFH